MTSQVIWHGGYSSVTALRFGPYWFPSGLLSDPKKTMSTISKMIPIMGINEINSHQPPLFVSWSLLTLTPMLGRRIVSP
jgi:hypothetical protein